MVKYYDRDKVGQISVMDFGLLLYQQYPYFVEQFGADKFQVLTDELTRSELAAYGFDVSYVYAFTPCENTTHYMKWFSTLSIVTQPFQVCPLEETVPKRDGNVLECEQIILTDNNPILTKWGIPQTGGVCVGDTLNSPNYNMFHWAYLEAREYINANVIPYFWAIEGGNYYDDENGVRHVFSYETSEEIQLMPEYDIAIIFGSIFYKYANDYGIQIQTYTNN